MRDFDTATIRYDLERLRIAAPEIFGANGHHFTLNAPLVEAEVLAFERQHAIRLPPEYRRFLTELGNGGAGPYYGVFPLGAFDGANGDVEAWGEFVGSLAEPFTFREQWNDLTGRPDDALADSDEEEYERRMDAFDTRYWHASVMKGAFPICHKGCALRICLWCLAPKRGTCGATTAQTTVVSHRYSRMTAVERPSALGTLSGSTMRCGPSIRDAPDNKRGLSEQISTGGFCSNGPSTIGLRRLTSNAEPPSAIS